MAEILIFYLTVFSGVVGDGEERSEAKMITHLFSVGRMPWAGAKQRLV
jgi:hypothetical protein